MKLHKIMSGGQTGADLTALEEATRIGLETGGWCPNHCRTETGPNWDLVNKYGLKETPTFDYQPRTRLNVRDSDTTLWFGNIGSPGYWCTLNACGQHGKTLYSNPSDEVLRSIADQYEIVNVAGNRASTNPGVVELVRKAFKVWEKMNPEEAAMIVGFV